MKRRCHTPEQVIRKLRDAERMLAESSEILEVAKALEIPEQTSRCWRTQYGGMKADDAKRLRELERENASLKQIALTSKLERRLLEQAQRGSEAQERRGNQAARALIGEANSSGRSWGQGCAACGKSPAPALFLEVARAEQDRTPAPDELYRHAGVPGCGASPAYARKQIRSSRTRRRRGAGSRSECHENGPPRWQAPACHQRSYPRRAHGHVARWTRSEPQAARLPPARSRRVKPSRSAPRRRTPTCSTASPDACRPTAVRSAPRSSR